MIQSRLKSHIVLKRSFLSSLGDLISPAKALLESSFATPWDQAPFPYGQPEEKGQSCLMYPSSSSSARWSLPNPEYYTLRYADGPQLYITEQVSGRGSSLLIPWVRVQSVLDYKSWNNTGTNPGGAASLLSGRFRLKWCHLTEELCTAPFACL